MRGIETMLDLQLEKMLARMAADGAPDLADLPPHVCRQVYRQILAAGDLPPADVQVEDRTIAGPLTQLPLRIYTPRGVTTKPRGIVLYCHGGGFVLGDLDAYDAVCRTICHDSDSVLVAVDYRLAPEHPFPAAVEDCYFALCWVAANAAELGADPQRLAVCGDSAGGNLSAVLALLARDDGPKISYQVLIYPVTSAVPGELASHDEFGEGYVLSQKAMHSFNRHYFGTAAKAPDFRGAPLLAEDVSGLPPAMIMVGGYDVLRDDGVHYAERLLAAGVPVTLIEYRGLSHGFINMAALLTGGRLALDQVGSALRLALG
ncbi:MAG: alpha/beta hydrolase [Desulfuromonadales bacterium]|nr:alpha/beta hydrolase [Desulfuromonadales bacterium]